MRRAIGTRMDSGKDGKKNGAEIGTKRNMVIEPGGNRERWVRLPCLGQGQGQGRPGGAAIPISALHSVFAARRSVRSNHHVVPVACCTRRTPHPVPSVHFPVPGTRFALPLPGSRRPLPSSGAASSPPPAPPPVPPPAPLRTAPSRALPTEHGGPERRGSAAAAAPTPPPAAADLPGAAVQDRQFGGGGGGAGAAEGTGGAAGAGAAQDFRLALPARLPAAYAPPPGARGVPGGVETRGCSGGAVGSDAAAEVCRGPAWGEH